MAKTQIRGTGILDHSIGTNDLESDLVITGSLEISGSGGLTLTGGPASGSVFSGSFVGDGSGLTDVTPTVTYRPTWYFPVPIGPTSGSAFWTEEALTVTHVNSVKGLSGTNAVIQMYYGSNRGVAGTQVMTSNETVTSTSGQQQTTFSNASIPAARWVWCDIISVSGAPEFISVTARCTG